MLYYQIQNYDEFKHIFGIVKHGDGTSGRKNKVLLAYLKDKRLLHEAVTSNRYGLLHITDMAGLEATMEREIRRSGDGSPGLPYRLVLMGKTYHSAVYETDSNEGICEDGDTKAVRYVNRKTGKTFKMKAGKLYRNLLLETEFGKRLPQKVVTYLSEKFAADWQVYATGKSPKSRLHVNQDFRKIYSSECCEGDFSSCMTDKGFHHFYKDAVDASAAYIENEDGKVIARCIIFNEVKDEDGETWRLAERQYASDNNDILKQTLVEALIDGGHIDGYKKVGAGCGDARAFVDNHGNSLTHKKFRISCDLDWGDTLSYQVRTTTITAPFRWKRRAEGWTGMTKGNMTTTTIMNVTKCNRSMCMGRLTSAILTIWGILSLLKAWMNITTEMTCATVPNAVPLSWKRTASIRTLHRKATARRNAGRMRMTRTGKNTGITRIMTRNTSRKKRTSPITDVGTGNRKSMRKRPYR